MAFLRISGLRKTFGDLVAVDGVSLAVDEGHTLLPQDWLIERVRDAEVAPPCAITGDWIDAFEDRLQPELAKVEAMSGGSAWQLDRYETSRSRICRVTC